MCLIPKKCIKIGKYYFPKIRIACKPIKVYKVLLGDSQAPCRSNYIYHKGKNYPERDSNLWQIRTGHVNGNWLHAYTRSQDLPSPSYKEVEMTIPKGAFYIEGTNNEIAASCLEW